MQTRGVFFKPGFTGLTASKPGYPGLIMSARRAAGMDCLYPHPPVGRVPEHVGNSRYRKSRQYLYCNVGLQLLLLAIIAVQKAQSIQRNVTDAGGSRCSDSRCSDNRYSDSRYSDNPYSDNHRPTVEPHTYVFQSSRLKFTLKSVTQPP